MELTLMTFNVQHFEDVNTGKIEIGRYAAFLRDSGAAAVGLNEVFEDQLAELARLLGWESFFALGCEIGGRRYGNGIVSRLPLIGPAAVPIPDPEVRAYDGYYEPRVLLTCALQTEGGPLNLCCTHFGLNPDEAENAVTAVTENLKQTRFVLMGDLNLRPEDPLLLPIRGRLTDTAPLLRGDPRTFPSHAPDRKLDYIFHSPDLTAVSADIPPLVLSDHRPYRCRIRIPDTEANDA